MSPTLYAYLIAKLREPTTYAGFVLIIGWITHRTVPPEIAVYIEDACAYIAGALLIWANERATAKNQTLPTDPGNGAKP